MTAAPFPPPITCPSSLIACCAPLLGFTPDRCLVAFVHGVPRRSAPVIVRVDLPTPGTAGDLARHTANSIAGTGGAAADLVAWVADPDDTLRAELSSSAFLAELHESLAAAGIEVGVILSTNGRVWWSHVCSDPGCCPQTATAVDPLVTDAVRAEYVYAGYAPLANRAQLAERVAADETGAADVRRSLDRGRPRPTARWRAAQLRFLTELLLSPDLCRDRRPLPSRTANARLLRALSDVRVRDVALHRLVLADRECPACWDLSLETLCAALRSAPSGEVAPVATVLALVAWMRGEGALATLCLQRAEEDPPYRLARLARELISRGTDPASWRASLAGLSEAECLDPGRVGPGIGTPEW